MEFNLHPAVSSCVTISSCVAVPHCVGMSQYGASLLVLVALRQGTFSQTETQMHGENLSEIFGIFFFKNMKEGAKRQFLGGETIALNSAQIWSFVDL